PLTGNEQDLPLQKRSGGNKEADQNNGSKPPKFALFCAKCSVGKGPLIFFFEFSVSLGAKERKFNSFFRRKLIVHLVEDVKTYHQRS
ncbi:MAG TPA: hypothetical protein VNB49_13365, partial [Candidatus Dormibacteraeota bacterium]|nr:hypothetical protein [Candidatus Dormibacteraeota bacterium]